MAHDRLTLAPTYYVYSLYAEAVGGTPTDHYLFHDGVDGHFASPAWGDVPAYASTPKLATLAVHPAGAPNERWLYVISRDTMARDLLLAIDGFAPAGIGKVHHDWVSGASYSSYNYYPDHQTDVLRETAIICSNNCREITVTVPPHTVSRFRYIANP